MADVNVDIFLERARTTDRASCSFPQHFVVTTLDVGLERRVLAVLYQEQETKTRLTYGLVGLAVAVVLIEVVTGFVFNGWGIIASVFLLIAAAVVFSMGRYNEMRLTDTTFRVGRHQFVTSDFDRDFGVQPKEALSDRELKYVLSPLPVPKSAPILIAGGSWAKPELPGYDLLVLRMPATDKKVVVVTRDEATLAPLLRRWLEESAG